MGAKGREWRIVSKSGSKACGGRTCRCDISILGCIISEDGRAEGFERPFCFRRCLIDY